MVAHFDMELEQMDVKTTFLHGELEETIYMRQPEAIEDLKKQLKGKFEMKDLGHALRMLEMEISRDRKRKTLKFTQKGYVNKVLERFSMSQAKPVSTPLAQHFKMTIENSPKIKEEVKYMEEIPYASVVGSIMYAMVCSRSDLVYATSMISRFMSSLGKEHWNVVKWVLRYLKGSIDVGILYGGGAIGELGVVVSWKASLQFMVALSSREAKYVALIEAMKEALWVKGMIGELELAQKTLAVHCDNQSAIYLTKNTMFHERMKHIDVKLHFLRDVVSKDEVVVEKIHTNDNPIDMLTKALTTIKSKHCLSLINILSN
ncbi:Retrovirus-related Pol polyprotein from transposon TNT 1-94 [Vitis vinifera]|uniref:Retrovirus-related Pol polyprotein from transposon TNT 1-94 n=1 Tax=Vitis vinifera TaxID=29760 RepID=A0A438E2E1_VITVI|nr:Retrovirus-related Pol polyprotein from transposon TNT 1-94 [Vitis vinifera]